MLFVCVRTVTENPNQVYCQVGFSYKEFAFVLWCVTIKILREKKIKKTRTEKVKNHKYEIERNRIKM